MISEIAVNKNLSKEKIYRAILPQIRELIRDESDLIANIANIVSVLKYSFCKFLWVGFYFYDRDKKELVLGPFQGKIACTRIRSGQGVCGSAVERKETVLVEDVDKFPGHIYCDSNSKSEIVVPVIKDNEVKAVLDIDSGDLNAFDKTDKNYLEELIKDISYIF
jgi:GAF domain-containing protein